MTNTAQNAKIFCRGSAQNSAECKIFARRKNAQNSEKCAKFWIRSAKVLTFGNAQNEQNEKKKEEFSKEVENKKKDGRRQATKE